MATPRGRPMHCPQYASLPEVLRGMVPEREYAWLSDAQKQSFVEDMTEPDADSTDGARWD